jgi:hypothetical protein
MLEQGLVNLLISDAGVSALISDRLYPVAGPPDNPTFPYATYMAVPVAESDYTFDGAESRRKTIQFDVWGNQFSDGLNILIAIRNVLSGYAGTLNEGTRVLFASRGNEMDNFDVDQRTYRTVCDYEIEFSEP